MDTFKISWTRYALQAGVWLVVFGFLLLLKGVFGGIAILLAIAWTAWIALQIFENYKTEIVIDDKGVWVYTGVLPWNKGKYGLNWRDISDAGYRTSFFSWAFNCYTVTVKHRYTRDHHLVLPHLTKGRELVAQINDIVAEKNLY